MLQRIEISPGVFWKFSKRSGIRINGIFKLANLHFIIVPRINENHIRIVEQIIPVSRVYVGTHGVSGVDIFNPHSNDLFLEFDPGTFKRRLISKGFLVIETVQPRLLHQPEQKFIGVLPLAGNGTVYALFGEQQGAQNIQAIHLLLNGIPKGTIMVQRRKFIKRTNDNW